MKTVDQHQTETRLATHETRFCACIAVTKDGEFAAFAHGDDLAVMSMHTYKIVRTYKFFSDFVKGVSCHGHVAVTCSRDRSARWGDMWITLLYFHDIPSCLLILTLAHF